ncbi:MAG: SufD family Fe-S cluster assembly protein [Acidobacteria bacterium]|nr:SufD family Fe-S cluster assembly protein [Acidobacteriota bacterium]
MGLYEEEFRSLVDIYKRGEGDKILGKTAGMVVEGEDVISVRDLPGIRLATRKIERGAEAELKVEPGVKLSSPIHFCFGMLPKEGEQIIRLKIDIGNGADVRALAHCIFPNAVKIIHRMDAEVRIGRGASYSYEEVHLHGDKGGVEVVPKAKVKVEKGGRYKNLFSLTQGRAGRIEFDYEVTGLEASATELIAKIHGRGDDDILIKEKVYLEGKNASGLVKSRVVLSDRARAVVYGETYGNAEGARGHVDCMEIITGDEVEAKAIPIVSVTNEKAKVTHEAAIGSVDKRQIEALLTRGLSPDEAVDIIVQGLLR